MIKIKRGLERPVVLNRQRSCKLSELTNENNRLYSLAPATYDSGTSRFSFESGVYAHENVKTLLMSKQYGKCAFCENNVTAVYYGDVEHFRPKKGFKQNEKDVLHYTGYYWLAYDYDNLIFACAICNQRNKTNLFPLRNPTMRALNHRDDIKREKPFFINPIFENPRQMIVFNEALAIGKDRKHRGKITIKSLGLNRKGNNGISDLFEERNTYYELMRINYLVSQLPSGNQISVATVIEAQDILSRARLKSSKFSAMINDNFPV